MGKNSTRDIILEAALQLIHDKGYKGATTKNIAELANVNEVTLFRQFESKSNLMKAIIDKYEYKDQLEKIFKENNTWDLKEDIKRISMQVHDLLEEKRLFILVSLKESQEFPELDESIKHIPTKYIVLLEEYFQQYKSKNNINFSIPTSILAENIAFVYYGYFMMERRINLTERQISLDEFIHKNINSILNTAAPYAQE